MSAKLYKVTITEIFGTHRVDVVEYWVAAITPDQAKKRALKWWSGLTTRYGRVHVLVENYRGGMQHIKSTILRPAS